MENGVDIENTSNHDPERVFQHEVVRWNANLGKILWLKILELLSRINFDPLEKALGYGKWIRY